MRCIAFYRTGTLARRARRAHASPVKTYTGSDHATGEASFEAKARNQSRHTSVGSRRIDLLVTGKRVSIGHTDSGRAADDAPRAEPGNDARRGRNGRRQSRYVPSLR
jgi:hypothetical protein